MPDQLRIGGFTPLTTIDFPGELAAVVFCQGCPWRCRYCHNGHLIPVRGVKAIAWEEIIAFLERRRGLLDAVVFSGGEPTLQSRPLLDALRDVRALGFKTGLHTAGPWPERLATLLPELDWVGMDIKTTEADYPRITGVPGSGERAWRSVALLVESGVPCEFRITAHPKLTDEKRLKQLKRQALQVGVEDLVVQPCITQHCLDEHLR